MTYYTAGKLNISTKLMARSLARRGALVGFDDRSPLNRFIFDTLLPLPVRDRSVRLHERDALAAIVRAVDVDVRHCDDGDYSRAHTCPHCAAVDAAVAWAAANPPVLPW